jgi:hypothetical protein
MSTTEFICTHEESQHAYLASRLNKPAKVQQAAPAIAPQSNITKTLEQRFQAVKDMAELRRMAEKCTELLTSNSELAEVRIAAAPPAEVKFVTLPELAAIPRPGVTSFLAPQAPSPPSSRSMAEKHITKDQAWEVAKWRITKDPRPPIKAAIMHVLDITPNNADSKLVQNCTHALLNPDYKAPSQKAATTTRPALDLEE